MSKAKDLMLYLLFMTMTMAFYAAIPVLVLFFGLWIMVCLGVARPSVYTFTWQVLLFLYLFLISVVAILPSRWIDKLVSYRWKKAG